MMVIELNYANGGNLTKRFTYWQLDNSNQMKVLK